MGQYECYGVIVPVKPPAVAKSRLGGLGADVRRALAAAFAADTVVSALAAEHVGLVMAMTDDHLLAADLARLGAQVLPDGTTDDLNESLVLAAAEVLRRAPHLRLAALCGDLPALRPAELGRGLAKAPDDRMGFVADADGSGTTLVTAPGLSAFRPAFGRRSSEGHLGRGAVVIDVDDVAGLRRDVDTPADLEAALTLGLGAHSRRAAAHLF